MHERDTWFVWGILLGLAVGGALMVLFAPAEGTRLRKNLVKQGSSLRRRALETAGDASSQIQERVLDVVDLARTPFVRRKRGLARLRFWEGR